MPEVTFRVTATYPAQVEEHRLIVAKPDLDTDNLVSTQALGELRMVVPFGDLGMDDTLTVSYD